MSAASAEIAKLSLNCFITMKIAFANAIGDVADRTPGADKSHILECVGSDARVGKRCLQPGYGFGGPCFPRDNRAFGLYASKVGAPALLCETTDEANKRHATLMVEALLAEEREEYLFEDVAYRPGCPVDMIEESQPLEVAKVLAHRGKKVTIKDRVGIVTLVRRTYGSLFSYQVADPASGSSSVNGSSCADGSSANVHAPAGVLGKRARNPHDTRSDTSMGNPLSSYRR
uniref:UDP-glucose/GDP-mannose dehydrogenase dimerisation domain-containing protein n=1 Tax=Haptolina brevifila TaxID=156173 RepID=A0A7S2H948_9EUKA